MSTGRFAPSPTGDLHVGNLATGLIAWCAARHTGGRFLLRVEDLDRANSRVEHERRQRSDLESLGIDFDGEVVRQSERFDHYFDALATLEARGAVYECYCTRREIQLATRAPHESGTYPGTCRRLSDAARAEHIAAGRPAALRLRATRAEEMVVDALAGTGPRPVDDIVLRRNDGSPGYHLAVVFDDADQGVTEVVRADDLLDVTASQIHLARHLDVSAPTHLHLPLVVNDHGERLAKRDGAVTLAERIEDGDRPADLVARIATAYGLAGTDERVTAAEMVERFDVDLLPRQPIPHRALLGDRR